MSIKSMVIRFCTTACNNKFSAHVSAKCIVTQEIESGGVWLYGVQPGAIAAAGKDLARARRDYHKRLCLVLDDMVTAAKSFAAFKREVDKFFAMHAEDDDASLLGRYKLKIERV